MSNQQIIKQLLIWGTALVILVGFLWGYKHSWWLKKPIITNQAEVERVRQEADKLMNEFAYWGNRIYLANAKNTDIKGEAAYRYLNDKYEQMMVAEMPELTNGYYYEAWIVQPASSSYISLGRPNQQADGRYILYFASDNNYSNFYRVVITKEASDGNSEPSREEILKGDFQ